MTEDGEALAPSVDAVRFGSLLYEPAKTTPDTHVEHCARRVEPRERRKVANRRLLRANEDKRSRNP